MAVKKPGQMGKKRRKISGVRKPIRPQKVFRQGLKSKRPLPKVKTRGSVSRAPKASFRSIPPTKKAVSGKRQKPARQTRSKTPSRSIPHVKKALPGKRQTPGRITFKPGQIRARLEAQKQTAKERRQRKAAEVARDGLRVRRSDRGKIVMITGEGKRNPQARGKRGLLVYVTKTGKKRLVKQHGKEPYKTRKITDIEPPNRGNLKKAVQSFQLARRQMISEHTAQLRGSGKVKTGGAYDFTDKASDKIAKTLKKTIEGQASHRSFYIDGMALVRLPDGKMQTIPFGLPIDKPDHIAIKLAGMKNFVRQKFYSFMARSLAELGYVTAGSTNHIRRLGQNEGLEREEWTDKTGEAWQGAELQTVHLENIEWRIEQIER
jgi:hypothetical protein